MAAFRSDLAKSHKAFADLVWPEIKSLCGGGDVRYIETSSHSTDRDLDILAGIDAYQILHGKGIRGIASRVQAVERPYDTFTIRYERRSAAGFDTEYKKRLAAVESKGELLSAYLWVQAYVTTDWSTLLSLAVVRVRDLFAFTESERIAAGGSFPRGRRNGCYLDTVHNDGAADFVVVPWARFKLGAGADKIKIRQRPHGWRRHGANRESAGDKPLTAQPWEWACLPCNKVGTGSGVEHRCLDSSSALHLYWHRRLRWALRDKTADEIKAILARPISRIDIIKWFGPSWSPSNDAISRDPGMVDG